MSAAEDHRDGGWNGRSIYILVILTLVSTLNYFDRSVMSLVLPLIKREFGVSDTTLGVITSLIVFYAIFGIPIAWAAERWSRRNVVAIGLFFWSLMTVVTGFAGSVWQLATCRFLMGVGEGCGLAPSQSMLGDVFSRARRPLALAILTTASSISLIFYSPIAGRIADSYGWRAAFLLAGAPGLVLAVLFVLTVREPRRRAAAATSDTPATPAATARPAGLVETLRFLAGSRAYLCCLAGTMLMGVYLYGSSAWTSMFFVRVRHFSVHEVGEWILPLRGAMSALGIVLGGLIASRLDRMDERWRCWVAALACVSMAPFEYLYIFADSKAVWLPAFMVANLFSIMHQGPIYAVYLSVAKPRMRSVSVAGALLGATVAGQFGGPILIGRLNDLMAASFGQEAIRYSWLVVVGSVVLGGLCYLLASRYLAADVARASDGTVEA